MNLDMHVDTHDILHSINHFLTDVTLRENPDQYWSKVFYNGLQHVKNRRPSSDSSCAQTLQ